MAFIGLLGFALLAYIDCYLLMVGIYQFSDESESSLGKSIVIGVSLSFLSYYAYVVGGASVASSGLFLVVVVGIATVALITAAVIRIAYDTSMVSALKIGGLFAACKAVILTVAMFVYGLFTSWVDSQFQ